jgi:hypothetical protein
MGAYLQLVTPGIPILGAFLYAGVYELPKAYDFSLHVGVHQHDPDRRLPRRRPARGHVRDRAGDGRARERDGHRSARAAPAQLHPEGASSRTRRSPASPTTRRPRRRRHQGRRADRLRRAPGPPGGAERRRAPPSARARRVDVLRDVRLAPPGARLAQLRRRRLGGGHGAGPAHQQGPGGHRHRAARPGARDVVER